MLMDLVGAVVVGECARCDQGIGPALSASSTISHPGACVTNAIPQGKVADQVVAVAAAVAAAAWMEVGTTCAQVTGSAIIASSITLPHETNASNAPALNDVDCSPSTNRTPRTKTT